MEKEESYNRKLENIAGEACRDLDGIISTGDLGSMLEPLQRVESNDDKIYQNYKARLGELRDISHKLLREQLKDISIGFSRYNTEPWGFETSLGKGASEVHVEMKYSGIQRKGNKLINFMKQIFFNDEKSDEVSLQATLRYGSIEELIAPLVFDLASIRKSSRYVTEKIANYIHQVVRHATSASASNKNENLDLYGWFEDNIVCKTARLLCSNDLIPIYLECATRYNIDELVSKAEKQFLLDAEKEKARYGEALDNTKGDILSMQKSLLEKLANPDGELVRCMNQGKERIREVADKSIEEIEKYKTQTYKRLEKDLLGEMKERRSQLERELSNLQKQNDELEKNLARRKGDIPKSRLYFTNELTRAFPDYDTYGNNLDIGPEKRAEYGRILADQLVWNKSLLKDEDVIKIIYAFSDSVKKSSGRKFNAKDMDMIINQTIFIASRIGPNALDTVVNEIKELGAKRKINLDKIIKVLDSLV